MNETTAEAVDVTSEVNEVPRFLTQDGEVHETRADAKAHAMALKTINTVEAFLDDVPEGQEPRSKRERTMTRNIIMKWETWKERGNGVLPF